MLRQLRCLVLAAAVLAAGCGRSANDDSLPVLRVADQLGAVQAMMSAAGENKPKNYRIEWSNFVGGPPIIAAETGGSVDLGWMAETPLVFAQAAGSPVKVVAVARGTRPGASNIALVVAADSPVRTVADLRGKKIGYMPGTVAQYLVVRALAEAGLSPKDVTTIRITGFSPGILKHGTVDALVSAEPSLSQSLAQHELRVLAYGGQPYTPGFGYLVASDAALADPRRSALIGDFVQRAARATSWSHEHVDQAAPYVAKWFKVTPQLAAEILKRTSTRYGPIDSSIAVAHQQEADLFFELGFIQRKVDAIKLFDNRYDKLIAQTEAKP